MRGWELKEKVIEARKKSDEERETFLTMQHVDVARGDAVVLHDVSLDIGVGEHVAILGPNGCGKSTLIKTLTCECYPIAQPQTMRSPLWKRALGHLAAASSAGSGLGGFAGRADSGDVGARCRRLGILLGIDAMAKSACD